MRNERHRFTDRVAIVTGAASGIGRRLACDLAAEGARVVVGDVADLAETVGEIEAAGGAVLAGSCDVSDRSQVNALVESAVKAYGRIDILMNNAGILLVGTLEETSDEIIDRTVDVNVKGVLYAVQAVAGHMKAAGYGRIVNVASITGKKGDGSTVPIYGASKGAVISMTRSLARNLGPHGITVNGVAPHAIMTPLMAYWDDTRRRDAAEQIPVRRLGTEADVSSLMLYLASEEAGFINGETVNINGGYYMD
jgi:3-oxoacyl-[acyl-carrier protein] reductase